MTYPVLASNYGFLPSASAAANKTAIQTLIANIGASGSGEYVYVEKGQYSCDGDVAITNLGKNITIGGAGGAMAYENGAPATSIKFTGGAVGFDFTALSGAGNYTVLKNMQINGDGVCANGVKACGMVQIEHVDVVLCTNAGVWLFDWINQSRLSHVSSSYNGGYGLLVGGPGNTGMNTIASFEHLNLRNNLVGARITNGKRMNFRNVVSESNAHEGLEIYKPAGGVCDGLTFDHCWFENNWATGGSSNYNVTIDSEVRDFSGGGPGFLDFDRCEFGAVGSTKAINIISAFIADFNKCGGTGDVTLGTYSTAVNFSNWNGGAIVDNGNHNLQESAYRSGANGGGRLLSGLYVKQLSVLGSNNHTTCQSGTPTTCYSMPSSAGMRYYFVFAKLSSVGTANAAAYSAYAIIAADSTTKILQNVAGTNLSISVSGLNIQVNQSTGVPQLVEVSVLPVFGVI